MATIATPELALTFACCRWPRSERSDAAVRVAATQVTDWDAFDRLVERHRVTPLVHDALARAEAPLPPGLAERLSARAAKRAVQSLAMVKESIRLQRAFDAAGLPALILKGTAVGVLAYGDPCLKESFDIDLLTSPEHIRDAHGLLETLGYELFEPAGLSLAELERFASHAVEATFLHRPRGLAVDLHWGIDRNRQLLPAVNVHSPSQLVPVAGAELRTLSDDLLYAYLCTHGTKHGWSRLKWIADLNAFLCSFDEAGIEQLHAGAMRHGARHASGVSLLLCKQLLNAPVPDSLVRQLKRNWRVNRLESASLHYIGARLATDETGAPPPILLFLSQFVLASSPSYFLEHVRNLWVHPTERTRYASWFHLLRIPVWLARRIKGKMPVTRRIRPEEY